MKMQCHQLPAWQQAIIERHDNRCSAYPAVDKRAWMRESLVALIERQVARVPHRPALVTESGHTTYKELEQAACRVARTVADSGADPTVPVALCFTRHARTVAAIFGVLKAGHWVVLLDHRTVAERNTHILVDSGAQLLYTDLDDLPVHFHHLPAQPQARRIDPFDTRNPAQPFVSIPPYSPAVRLVYSSGSTGQSKGILQTAEHLLHAITNLHNLIRFSSDDTFLDTTAGLAGILGPLLRGATAYPVDLKQDGLSAIKTRIVRDRVSVCHTIPSVLRHFVGLLGPDETLPGPRVFVLVGEAATRADCERFVRAFPDTAFVNVLGSKESIDYRAFVFDKHTPIVDAYAPAGYPLADTEVLLLDGEGRVAPPGAVGEIAVKSTYLSPGYWQNAELTAQRFIPDPTGRPGRVYRTGDLGRLLPDGCLLTVGRNDRQVKIRGNRVQLDEVEAALCRLNGVRECAVLFNPDSPGAAGLDAFVVLHQPNGTAFHLRAELAGLLPDYMLPGRFVFIDALPRGPMGKVDRGALRLLEATPRATAVHLEPPRTPSEEMVAAIWGDVLEIDIIGIHDPFLELGGNSLQAMRIAARVQDEFGVEIPLAELFAASTVAEMALAITAHLVAQADAPAMNGIQ